MRTVAICAALLTLTSVAAAGTSEAGPIVFARTFLDGPDVSVGIAGLPPGRATAYTVADYAGKTGCRFAPSTSRNETRTVAEMLHPVWLRRFRCTRCGGAVAGPLPERLHLRQTRYIADGLPDAQASAGCRPTD